MQDGSRFTCRTHTAASYVRVKAWCQTWEVVPGKIEEVKKPKASLRDATKWDLIYRVYFVRLLSFEVTAAGKSYYKIGKAKVVPKRNKHPCTLFSRLTVFPPQSYFYLNHRLWAMSQVNLTAFVLELNRLPLIASWIANLNMLGLSLWVDICEAN